MEIAGLIPKNNLNGLLNFKRETFQGISVSEFGDSSVMKWSLLNEKNYRLMPTDVLIKVLVFYLLTQGMGIFRRR